jgi:hypothetical protein
MKLIHMAPASLETKIARHGIKVRRYHGQQADGIFTVPLTGNATTDFQWMSELKPLHRSTMIAVVINVPASTSCSYGYYPQRAIVQSEPISIGTVREAVTWYHGLTIDERMGAEIILKTRRIPAKWIVRIIRPSKQIGWKSSPKTPRSDLIVKNGYWKYADIRSKTMNDDWLSLVKLIYSNANDSWLRGFWYGGISVLMNSQYDDLIMTDPDLHYPHYPDESYDADYCEGYDHGGVTMSEWLRSTTDNTD